MPLNMKNISAKNTNPASINCAFRFECVSDDIAAGNPFVVPVPCAPDIDDDSSECRSGSADSSQPVDDGCCCCGGGDEGTNSLKDMLFSLNSLWRYTTYPSRSSTYWFFLLRDFVAEALFLMVRRIFLM